MPLLTAHAGSIARTSGWACAALLFGTLLSSIRHVDHAGLVPGLLLVALVLLSAIRPLDGLAVAAALVPVATYVAIRHWNGAVSWPSTVVYAVLAGVSIHALTPPGRRAAVPAPLTTPAFCFGALVTASMIVVLSVTWLRLGPPFAGALLSQITREHFVDVRSFPALHAGLLLLDGVLLFIAAARLSAARGDALPRIAAAVTIGAVGTAGMTAWRLYGAASRPYAFWPAIARLTTSLRWNVAYADFNAAGSYFLMAGLLAVGLAVAARRRRVRALGVAAAVVSAGALWLTGSRAAVLAGVVVLAAAAAIRLGRGSRPRLLPLAALGASALIVGLALAVLLPAKGNQQSSWTATDVRVGLAQTSARMIARSPVFGIGLAEFSRRSGEFSSPALLATFPPAEHENAHNNFLQVAAELGLAGGAAFVWLIAAALWYAAPSPQREPDPVALFACVGLAGFVLTWLGGHPLLVPEAAIPFWILLGAAAGRGARGADGLRRRLTLSLGVVLVLAATLPSRLTAARQDAELEHVGIGVSQWQTQDDVERYRTATGAATVFVPTGSGFRLRVKPLTDHPVSLELQLDGRAIDRIVLIPATWNDVRIPARTQRPDAKYAALHLVISDPAGPVTFRVTKVQPLGPAS